MRRAPAVVNRRRRGAGSPAALRRARAPLGLLALVHPSVGLGHPAGDRALAETAQLLRETFRDSDVIARLGGDEFTVMLTGCERSTADTVMERVRLALEARNAVPGRAYPLALSIGLARFDRDRAMSLDDLLGAADMALYATKRRRKQAA